MTALEFSYAITQSTKALKPFALRLTRDMDDAADLLQDTVLKAFVHKDKFSEGTNLKAWMYTIMKNTFITNYQKLVKRRTFIDTTENLHFINSTQFTTRNDGEQKFTMDDIQKALSTLENSFREPFMMYFHGYKYHEISDKLSIPIGTVKNRIHLARKELKDVLKMYQN
jgi:RNA polymerase sigma-70 factor (ECF subfamily)